MEIALSSERLYLKQMNVADAQNMFILNSDPEVIQYTGDVMFTSVEDALNLINNYDQYEKYKMGRLSLFDKVSGEYIGWCGLKYLEDRNQVDIGYRLLKKHWGKGYATEAARVCLDYGFNTLNLKEIIATAMLENPASINIFRKLGMKYDIEEPCGGKPGVIYKIKKSEWK
ncbi:GNAT family N-acetyltransferase [Pedobacter nyackensis]|uniref:Protein N-acetyltransferase, RimJ/RimL family n=1 Tax=Pedobacter nyackensis TaxID=475255 RepID=A0A1W2DI49_9SPHI|nr:GNAT family N-acetyltransferase [Pedobacter nyackensis]SMC97143.1 Protein N-acetyltransferase, RimJ/RimL family [Pedobacter nyackensis]